MKTEKTKGQWGMFNSKLIVTRNNIFILLRDKKINSSLIEGGKSVTNSQPLSLLHIFIQINAMSINVILQITENMEKEKLLISILY